LSYTGTSPAHAFHYSGGTMKDLGTLGGPSATGAAINNAGVVVGYADLDQTSGGQAVHHAFAYTGGAMKDLGTLGGTNSEGHAINNLGQIVGTADRSDGAFRAFFS